MTRFALLVCSFLFAFASTAQEAANAWNLEQFMQQRAQAKGARARFIEVRKVPAVDTTIISSGVLIYEAPDRLERQTTKPSVERTVIQGDRITLDIEGANGKHSRREFALNDLPGLRPLFTALRTLMNGDLETLQKKFRTTFTGTEDSWRLKLTPREAADRHVNEITVTGQGANMSVLEIRETSGDSTRITLTPESTTGGD